MRQHARVAGAVVCSALVMAGCGVGPVELESAELSDADRAVCDELLASLPSQVGGQSRRDVSPYGAGAAWGDPATTLRCGVTDAQGMKPTMRCQVVDGVGWYSEELERGYRFTTIGRQTYVEVVVPTKGDEAPAPLFDIAEAVRQTVPVEQPCV